MVKNYGPNTSGYLDPDLKSFETAVYQTSKPVLDKELNLIQDLAHFKNRQFRSGVPSGWLSPEVLDTSHSGPIYVPTTVSNEYGIGAMAALVNGWRVLVQYTNSSTGSNKIDLGPGPSGVSAKRVDLVFLEVWRKLISSAPDLDGKSLSGRIWRNGNVKISSSDDATLNPTDDILDANVGTETTKRVQVQYRLRVAQGVNLDLYPQGLGDPSIVAHTVPTDALTPDGDPTAYTYSNQSSNGDPGLWVAGDGNPANGLGSVDGYVYAIPLSVIFRRNTSAFDRDINHNGGVASPGPSDRPDGYFHDIIEERDVMDLRMSVSTSGWDLQELLTKNVNYLFDNQLKNQYSTTNLGGGSQGHTQIWADEIGPADNGGALRIRDFDSVSRRFSDRPILETVWLRYTPADQTGGGATWNLGGELVINPLALPVYPYPSTNFAATAPGNVSILDVPCMAFAWDGTGPVRDTRVMGYVDDYDGSGSVAVLPSLPRATEGLGDAIVSSTVTLALNDTTTPAGVSGYDLYVQLVISYPSGSGLTKTPTSTYGSNSFVLETPSQLPAAAPYLYSSLEDTSFDFPHREVELTYRTLAQVNSSGFPGNNLGGTSALLFVPERVRVLTSITNVTTSETYTGALNLTPDGYFVLIDNTAANWSGGTPASTSDQIDINYEGVRPIPDNGINVTLWYEARAPQTIQDSLIGTTLRVIPRYTSPHLYSLVTGPGSLGEAYPFPQQYVQSPGVYPSSENTFEGDHELAGIGDISVTGFDASSGFLQLPTLIPAVPEPQSLILHRSLGDIDAEQRSFFKEVPPGYIPSCFGQPFSDPKRHKNCLPMICELAEDGSIGPKGTLLLVMFSRWAPFDAENSIAFDPTLEYNFTSASVYRLRGNPLNVRRN